jgi:GNAT superfamily N-acetyltransferase
MSMMAKPTTAAALTWRTEVTHADIDAVRRLVAGTDKFTAAEIDIAAELVEDRLKRGDASEYFFVLADDGDRLAGYTCYGPIAGTDRRYDLYWIAVDQALQRAGLGSQLLERTEDAIRAADGALIYIETSTLAAYIPTRAFYVRNGYLKAAVLPDFYRTGDGKAIFVKTVGK